MIALIFLTIFSNFSSIHDLYLLGVDVNSALIYENSPDFIPILYSILTNKGDCLNMALIYNHLLMFKGINNNIILLDTNNDKKLDHAIVRINDSRYGCFNYDLVNLSFRQC